MNTYSFRKHHNVNIKCIYIQRQCEIVHSPDWNTIDVDFGVRLAFRMASMRIASVCNMQINCSYLLLENKITVSVRY